MPLPWKVSNERRKRIDAAMKPLRGIQKMRSTMVVTQEMYSLKMIHQMMKDGQLCNAKQNRDPVWTTKKMQGYITSLFVDITAPKEFLVREADDEEGDNTELQIFDGNNRITSIGKFMENEFPIPVNVENAYYCELAPCDRGRFDKTLAQFLKLTNCPVVHACEMAEKRNEGTPMSIGEKTTLMRHHDTPRCAALDLVMNSAAFMDLPEDRASGIKVVAQLIQSIEAKGGIKSPSFKLTDYHMPCTRTFFKSPANLVHVDPVELVSAFMKVGELCPDERPPPNLQDTAALKDKKTPTKCMYFYMSVISMVASHLRNGTPVTNANVLQRFRTICDRAREAREEKKAFQVGGKTIDGLY